MDLITALKGIRLIGWRNAVRGVLYAWERDRAASRYAPPAQPPAPALTPGQLLTALPVPGGLEARFEHAELEIRFLAPDLVRVTWGPGTPPLPYALARVDWPEVAVAASQSGDEWQLSTPALGLTLDPAGALTFRDPASRVLRAEPPPARRGERWTHRARLQPGERLFGLGERTTPLDLRGATLRQWNTDPGGQHRPGNDPLYLCIPVYVGLHAQGSYLVFFENPHDATFHFDRGGPDDEATAAFEGGLLRTYLIPGPPDRALERYTELTGRPPLPPRWALGYHQCRWGYRTAGDIRAVVEGFRIRDLPLSAVHLDIDYMDRYRVFTVNRERFPDLAGLARECGEQGVRLVTIVDPGVQQTGGYDVYAQGLDADVFCKLPGSQIARAPVWPGWCAFPDFTAPRVRAWWGQYYARLLDQGISGIWHDMNEPAASAAWGEMTLPRAVRHDLEGRGGDHGEAHNVYGLLMNRAGFEAQRDLRPEQRPFLLSRSGWAGVQRHAWTWTADTASTWDNLRQTVVTVLGVSLSGAPYTGPDVGGFNGVPSPELFVRWLQLATFLPFFRTHQATGQPAREPWSFGDEALGIAREFLKLRYRLMPYLYTLAWQTSRDGRPLVRPLWWPAGRATALHGVEDAFFLGDALLVAPVVTEGATAREVPVPAGLWYSFWDDAPQHGLGTVTLAAPPARIPLLVRAGSVLPLEDGRSLQLHVYAPEDERMCASILYTDAGDGCGPARVDTFRLTRRNGELELAWQSEGEYAFPYDGVEVHVHGMAVRQATVDGAEAACEGNHVATQPFARAMFN